MKKSMKYNEFVKEAKKLGWYRKKASIMSLNARIYGYFHFNDDGSVDTYLWACLAREIGYEKALDMMKNHNAIPNRGNLIVERGIKNE